jgi:hypothetical protein
VLPKRRIGKISQGANKVLARAYKLVRMSKRGFYVCYKGLRYGDRPKKRVALGQIAAN